MRGKSRWVAVVAVAAATLAAVCAGSAASLLDGSDPVLLAAGDIATCPGTGDEATAAVLDGYPDATVAALGDLVYDAGTPEEFRDCYGPSWGRHKARTKPAAGNHEYKTPGATGYFGYFGAAAGPSGKGWYSYDLGSWHVVVLNSNCVEVTVDCAATSEQVQWLEADLAASEAACTLAYWHHPLFTSGMHAGEADLPLVRPFWDALYEHGADVVLVGHDHSYERFAPQTPTAAADAAYGIRQFVVGTGGAPLRALKTPAANSEVFHTGTFGVLKLSLHPSGYDWQFLPEAGKTFTDTGSGACHGAPPTPSSGSHSSAWSNDRTVDVTWSGASDGGSGVDGFSYSWTQNAADSPDTIKDAEETATGTTSPELADGAWWFHLRTRDNAGNWSDAVHLGPFKIDGTAPTSPTPASTHPSGWTNDPTVDVSWSAAADTHSGVSGYSYSWTQAPDDTPDTSQDTTGTTANNALESGQWWFHLRAVDNAGNWAAPVHLGPFRIDVVAPTSPTPSSSHSTGWSNDPTVDASWTAATDAHSGVSGYSHSWTQTAGEVPDTLQDTAGTTATSPSLASGQWWFHLRAVDNAGNWTGAVHLGPFRIDTTAPAGGTLSSGSHSVDTWSAASTVDIAWSGITEAHSGLDGFSYEWSRSASTAPDATKELEESASATSGTLADGDWWFHLRALDNAGNVAGTIRLGPFRIDTTPPSNPAPASPSHTVDAWSNDRTIEMRWAGAADAGSGIDGFSYSWTQSAGDAPDALKEVEETAAETTSLPLADGDWWFHLRTRDNLGHWSGAVHVGPYRIDATAPSNPVLSSPSHKVGEWSNEPTVVVEWTAEPGYAYSYVWSVEQLDDADTFAEEEKGRLESVRPDGTWWLHLRARNAANVWGGSAHYGPFLIDTTPPETYAAATNAGFEFSASEDASFACALDGGAYIDCVSPVHYDNLAPGEHLFRVVARDRAGNVDPSAAELRWTIAPQQQPQPQPQPQTQPQPQPQPEPPPAPLPRKDVRLSCVVPRLGGTTLRRARTLLTRSRCRLGRVTYAYSRRVRKGLVLRQSPRAGRRLARGARVSVVLSRGALPRRN